MLAPVDPEIARQRELHRIRDDLRALDGAARKLRSELRPLLAAEQERPLTAAEQQQLAAMRWEKARLREALARLLREFWRVRGTEDL
jgi:hypothetical protein